jgi:hypothetical protein
MAIAGRDWNTNTILDSVQISLASASGSGKNWSVDGAIGNLTHKRWLLNAVLLPNTQIVALGGEKLPQTLFCRMTLVPELFDPATLAWAELARARSSATTSTALLLLSGKV